MSIYLQLSFRKNPLCRFLFLCFCGPSGPLQIRLSIFSGRESLNWLLTCLLSLLSLLSPLSRSPRFQILCKAPISCERLQIVLSLKRCPAEKSKKFLSHRKMNWPRSDPRTIKPFLWPTFKSLLFPIISTIYPQQGRASFKTFSYLVVKSASPVLKLFPLTDRAGSVGIFSINHLTVINLEWAVQLNYLYKITKHNRKVNNVYHWWPVILGSNETQGK